MAVLLFLFSYFLYSKNQLVMGAASFGNHLLHGAWSPTPLRLSLRG